MGAQTELKKALEEMDHDGIQRRLSKDFNADWVIRIPQRLPMWVVSGNARYGVFDPFYLH